MEYNKIRENLIDVIGVGWFVVGICSILNNNFTIISLGWFILGCLWLFYVLFRTFEEKNFYTAYILLFTFLFLISYLIGNILGIYKFKPEGLLY